MEATIWELYCLACHRRLSTRLKPQLLCCRHLGCVNCFSSPLECPICGDLRNNVVIPDHQRLAPKIERIGDLTFKLDETPPAFRANALQQLTDLLEAIKHEFNFQGVPCKYSSDCAIQHCPYHDNHPAGLREGEMVILEEDKCGRCHQPIQTLSVPFCVHCGFVENITEGTSVPNPLQPVP